jgi:hypothetical protein
MRCFFVGSWMVVACLAAANPAQAAAAGQCEARSGAVVTPLVELYTSEGCSSCPPADRWLSRQLSETPDTVNWLAFHVDYWDELGWPDRFASPKYSQRQRQRVNAVGQATVYTPQVMIGAQVQTVWRAGAAVNRALDAARVPAQVGSAMVLLPQAQGATLRLGAARGAGRSIGARKDVAGTVWLAQTVDGLQTQVRAGENEGVTLNHDRVVTRLWGPWSLGSEALGKAVDVDLPERKWGLTAFVQDASGNVLQSLRLDAADCH